MARVKRNTSIVVRFMKTYTLVALNLACGKARGRRIPRRASVTDEPRSHKPNSAQPAGRPFFFGPTSLLAPFRSTVGYARPLTLIRFPRLFSIGEDLLSRGTPQPM